MEAKLFGIPQRLNEIRKSVVTTRLETPQDRASAIDPLLSQMAKEEIGSQRYEKISDAFSWLCRQPERTTLVIFGKDLPLWF